MRWTYDASVGALYMDVRPGEIESQVEMADGVIVDITSTGSIVGLEVLGPERPWNLDTVAERFGLSAEERDTIKFIAGSQLMHLRSATLTEHATTAVARGGVTSVQTVQTVQTLPVSA